MEELDRGVQVASTTSEPAELIASSLKHLQNLPSSLTSSCFDTGVQMEDSNLVSPILLSPAWHYPPDERRRQINRPLELTARQTKPSQSYSAGRSMQ